MSKLTELLQKNAYQDSEKEGYGIILWITIIHITIATILHIQFVINSLLYPEFDFSVEFVFSFFFSILLVFSIWSFFKRKSIALKLLIIVLLVNGLFSFGKYIYYGIGYISIYAQILYWALSILAIAYLAMSKSVKRIFRNN